MPHTLLPVFSKWSLLHETHTKDEYNARQMPNEWLWLYSRPAAEMKTWIRYNIRSHFHRTEDEINEGLIKIRAHFNLTLSDQDLMQMLDELAEERAKEFETNSK